MLFQLIEIHYRLFRSNELVQQATNIAEPLSIWREHERLVPPNHFTRHDHPRAGRVLGAAFLHHLYRYVRIRDDEGGLSANPDSEDWTVLFAPLLESKPWL